MFSVFSGLFSVAKAQSIRILRLMVTAIATTIVTRAATRLARNAVKRAARAAVRTHVQHPVARRALVLAINVA